METLASVLVRCTALERQSRIDDAVDTLTEYIDNALIESEFDSVDDFLKELRVEDCSTDILITILTATLPANRELSERAAFVERVATELGKRNEPVRSLMWGLS